LQLGAWRWLIGQSPGNGLANRVQQFLSYLDANDVADARATLGALTNEA
jgi:hypothetical protein